MMDDYEMAVGLFKCCDKKKLEI